MKTKKIYKALIIIFSIVLIIAFAFGLLIGYYIYDGLFTERNYTSKYKIRNQYNTIWVCDHPETVIYVLPLGNGLHIELNNADMENAVVYFWPGLDRNIFIEDKTCENKLLLHGECRFRENEFRVKVEESNISDVKVGSTIVFHKVDTFPDWADIDFLTTDSEDEVIE